MLTIEEGPLAAVTFPSSRRHKFAAKQTPYVRARRDLSFPCTVFSRVFPLPVSPQTFFQLSFSLLSWSIYLFRSHAPIYFFLLLFRPHTLTLRLYHVYDSLLPYYPPHSVSISLSLPPSLPSILSVRGTNRRVPRDTLVSRALAGEKSRNDVTLLGRNRENRENPDHRDHPARQEPRVSPGTRADKGFQAKSVRRGRRAHPGRSDPSARRERQDFRVRGWVRN